LAGIGRRVWVVHEVALGRKACSVLLVLLLAILKMSLLSALGMRLEDGVWEGRGGGGIGATVGNELGIVVPEVEIETVLVVVLHREGGCRFDRYR
jgi:hypothetical protein